MTTEPSNHTLSNVDEQIDKVRQLLQDMYEQTGKQLQELIEFLTDPNKGLPLDVLYECEEKINQNQVELNKTCILFLARHSPVANDLRYIGAAMRMTSDWERIGDELCKIANFFKDEMKEEEFELWLPLRTPLRQARTMHEELSRLQEHWHTAQALRLIDSDSDLNASYMELMQKSISEIEHVEHSNNIRASVYIMLAAKAIERIGDHIVNICEAYVYYMDGLDVRAKHTHSIYQK